jgi:hypothetical protein
MSEHEASESDDVNTDRRCRVSLALLELYPTPGDPGARALHAPSLAQKCEAMLRFGRLDGLGHNPLLPCTPGWFIAGSRLTREWPVAA